VISIYMTTYICNASISYQLKCVVLLSKTFDSFIILPVDHQCHLPSELHEVKCFKIIPAFKCTVCHIDTNNYSMKNKNVYDII
jgi:hypothetical protein